MSAPSALECGSPLLHMRQDSIAGHQLVICGFNDVFGLTLLITEKVVLKFSNRECGVSPFNAVHCCFMILSIVIRIYLK